MLNDFFYIYSPGGHCEMAIGECALQPCRHGYCLDHVTGHTCVCHDGYSGRQCEENIDDCASDPCFHGNCTDHVNGYECQCDASYAG